MVYGKNLRRFFMFSGVLLFSLLVRNVFILCGFLLIFNKGFIFFDIGILLVILDKNEIS